MIFVVAWIAMPFLGLFVAIQKHRSGGEGLLLGLFFGPFGVLIEALLPSATPQQVAEKEAMQALAWENWQAREKRIGERQDAFLDWCGECVLRAGRLLWLLLLVVAGGIITFPSLVRRAPGWVVAVVIGLTVGVAGVATIGRVIGEWAGIKGRVRPHGLRHAAITAALDRRDVRDVAKFSRHKRLETLVLYDDRRKDVGGDIARELADDQNR